MKKRGKKGFTMIEIMLTISIIGLLAALSIPAILKAYSNAQEKAKAANIVAVEKAKGVLTLPRILGMQGAMGLKATDAFDEAVVSNLCIALRIDSISKLKVGNIDISLGSLTEKAYYE